MNSVVLSVISFIVALTILVAVHEFGHFWVARKLGVKVLRFSIGFGKPIWSKCSGSDNTEFAIAAIPLGGYVKMLDEREGDVEPSEAHRAFNRQPLLTRTAVVAAGPFANLIFAALVYAGMYTAGIPGIKPVVGNITHGFAAEASDLQTGDEIIEVAGRDTPTWKSVIITLLREVVMDNDNIEIKVRRGESEIKAIEINLANYDINISRSDLLKDIGFEPWHAPIPPVIGLLEPGGIAEKFGFEIGDKVLTADGMPISEWMEWVEYVRSHPEKLIKVEIQRDGSRMVLDLIPQKMEANGETYGRIGAGVDMPESIIEQRRSVQQYSPHKAIWMGIVRTWDISTLTLKMFWKMLIGQASLENVSGPITIAEYAGHSASIGWMPFFGFLALVSISLGVINLVPIPLLDGGHLMYYIIEFFKGSPVSENTEIIGQKIGIILLVGLMALAFYNDLVRLLTN